MRLPTMKKKTLARSPRLDTVLMVEKFIQEKDGEYKKKQLWENLPKKMMYQTYSTIIDYLLVSGKISVDGEGKIGWIFYPEEAKKRFEMAHLTWKGGRKKFNPQSQNTTKNDTNK